MSIPQQVRDPQKHRNMLNYCTAINNRLTGKAAVGKRPTEKPQIFNYVYSAAGKRPAEIPHCVTCLYSNKLVTDLLENRIVY